MRVMVLVKANKESEAGVMPPAELFVAMGKYNEELAKAGILLAADGLHPSSRGVRVHFSGTRRTVTDGPFAETKELVAGFWLWHRRSPAPGCSRFARSTCTQSLCLRHSGGARPFRPSSRR